MGQNIKLGLSTGGLLGDFPSFSRCFYQNGEGSLQRDNFRSKCSQGLWILTVCIYHQLRPQPRERSSHPIDKRWTPSHAFACLGRRRDVWATVDLTPTLPPSVCLLLHRCIECRYHSRWPVLTWRPLKEPSGKVNNICVQGDPYKSGHQQGSLPAVWMHESTLRRLYALLKSRVRTLVSKCGVTDK